MFVITMYFEGLKEDWFCQLGHPRKIKNLLTYLLMCQVSLGLIEVQMGAHDFKYNKVPRFALKSVDIKFRCLLPRN